MLHNDQKKPEAKAETSAMDVSINTPAMNVMVTTVIIQCK